MAKIKFIYFDVGNVFLRFEHARLNLAKKEGFDPQLYKDELNLVIESLSRGKMNYDTFWAGFCSKYAITSDITDLADYLTDQFVPIQEMHEFAHVLSKNYAIGLLTDVPPKIHSFNTSKGLIPDVPYKKVVESCNIGFIKPEKEIYEYAQSFTKCDPHEVLFIDDIECNVRGAQAYGWNAIQFDPNDIEFSMQAMRKALNT